MTPVGFFWSGRFISADTLIASFGNPQSLNRYSYVYNRPINHTDPTGHKACDEQWGCNGEGRPPSTTPGKGDTDTNAPGGSNTPADQAASADDTGGDDTGGGYSPEGSYPPLPTTSRYGAELLCRNGGGYSACTSNQIGRNLMRIWIPGDDILVEWGGDRVLAETRRVKYFGVNANLINNWAGLQVKDMKEINAFVSSNTEYQRLSDGPSFNILRAGVSAALAAAPEYAKDGNIGWAEAGWATLGAIASFGIDAVENTTAIRAAETNMQTNYNSISGYEEVTPAGVIHAYYTTPIPVYPSGFYGVPGF